VKRFRRRGRRRGEEVREEEGEPGSDESTRKPGESSDTRPAPEPEEGSGARSRARRSLADRVGETRGSKPDTAAAEGREKPRRKGPARKADGKRSPSRPGTAAGDEGEKPRRREASGKAGDERSPSKPLHRPRPQPRDRSERDGAGKRRRRAAERAGRDRESSRRRRARSGRQRAKAAGGGLARALKRGAAETRRRVAVAAPKAARAVLAALAAVFALFFALVGVVLTALIAAGLFVAGPIAAVLRALDRAARAASRRLTPARVLTLVVAGAAILLALSQYADYRVVSIGNDAYSGVQTVAPAPETGRLAAGDPHSYAFVPVAIACLLLLAAAVIGGRWRLLRLVALAGVAAIAVALIVDRPAGLDPGDAAVSFEGVRATLIGGFYAQIAAGVLLIGSSSLLARELRLAGARRAAPDRTARARRTVERRRAAGTPGDARA
jgi:hypothetical protein